MDPAPESILIGRFISLYCPSVRLPLTDNGLFSDGQGVAVQIHLGEISLKAADHAVALQSPGGLAVHYHGHRGIAVAEDRAGNRLADQIQRHMAAVGAALSPGIRGSIQEYAAVRRIVKGYVLQGNRRGHVRHMEHGAGFRRHGAAGHGKGRSALAGIAAHALINQHIGLLRGLTVQGAVVAGQGRIRQGHAVSAFNDDRFGRGGGQGRAGHTDLRRGIDGRRAFSGRRVVAAGHVDGSAAPVAADRRGGIAAGADRHVDRVHRSAAGGHQAAGIIAAGHDAGIADIHGRTGAVAEDAVGMGAVGGNRALLHRQGGAVLCQDRGVDAVEIRAVPVRGTGFGHGGAAQGHRITGNQDRVFTVRA